ncbi:MAG: DUF3667 domain-containing protein [Gemmatimonadetes bacterium]|nr:DUF3667 domain-containing protein [Gemmatimonadota bacterium]
MLKQVWGAGEDPRAAPEPYGVPLPVAAACPNCGDATPGNFCRNCGQARRDMNVSLREIVADFLEDQLALSARLPRTLAWLLFRPGLLTREYLAGRIARYLQPLRLYLMASVAFFLVLPYVADVRSLGGEIDRGMRKEGAQAAPGAAKGVRGGPDTMVVLQRGTNRMTVTGPGIMNGEKIVRLPPMDTTRASPWLRPLMRRAKQQEERLNGMTPGEAIQVLAAGFEENAPKAVFVLLPVFALLLKGLHLRRGRLYVEHFVFALHVHAFAFLLFTAMLLAPDGRLNLVLGLWFLAYLFLAMRRVYGQGLRRTLFTYFALLWGYSFVLLLGMIGTLVVTLMTV